jgi:hypothetical protein
MSRARKHAIANFLFANRVLRTRMRKYFRKLKYADGSQALKPTMTLNRTLLFLYFYYDRYLRVRKTLYSSEAGLGCYAKTFLG